MTTRLVTLVALLLVCADPGSARADDGSRGFNIGLRAGGGTWFGGDDGYSDMIVMGGKSAELHFDYERPSGFSLGAIGGLFSNRSSWGAVAGYGGMEARYRGTPEERRCSGFVGGGLYAGGGRYEESYSQDHFNFLMLRLFDGGLAVRMTDTLSFEAGMAWDVRLVGDGPIFRMDFYGALVFHPRG